MSQVPYLQSASTTVEIKGTFSITQINSKLVNIYNSRN